MSCVVRGMLDIRVCFVFLLSDICFIAFVSLGNIFSKQKLKISLKKSFDHCEESSMLVDHVYKCIPEQSSLKSNKSSIC